MYQEQLQRLIDERCALERALGDNQARIDQALLMIGAMVEGSRPLAPVLDVTRELRPVVTSQPFDPYSTRSLVVDLLEKNGVMTTTEIVTECQLHQASLSNSTVRAAVHALYENKRIERLGRAKYGPKRPVLERAG